MRQYGKMHVLVVAALLLGGVASSSACSELCKCENGQVQCQGAELTSIPEGLGDDTVVLDLSYNNITIISGKDFDSMPMLKRIVIVDSGVENIQPEAFSSLLQLELVDFRSNAIESLHPSLFQDNLYLITLDLSDNLLKTFDCHLNLEVKFLNLSENQLTSESISSFPAYISLESLDISHNYISNLSSDIFSAMINLTHLDMSGNPQLEYDCDLKTLWILCRDRSINCVIDDEQSWKMVENLDCGDEGVTEEETTTSVGEGFMSVPNSMGESENSSKSDMEGSGAGDPGTVPIDPILDSSLVNSTGEVTDEPAIMAEGNWIMIVIIVCVVVIVLLVIAVVVMCIVRRRKTSVENTGNISHANSIQYLNQDDEFNPSYKNSRNNSVKKSDNSKVRINNFDRVLNPPDYSKTEPNRDVIPLGDYTTAEVVRTPSFKTHGIATPFNLPKEISPSSQSLPRSSPASSCEDNTLRAGSLRRYAKPEQGTVPDTQIIPPVRRVPSNKRR